MGERPITILLVDDHPVVRSGYRRLFEQAGGIEVLAEANDGEEGYVAYARYQPAVVVMDISMPGLGGLEAARRILMRDPKARILVFSVHENDVMRRRAREMGAFGYVTKRAGAQMMVEAVRTVARGEPFFCGIHAGIQGHPGTPPAAKSSDSPFAGLTPKEFEVFRHLAEGRAVAEIASILHASPKTVGVHQTRIMNKLGIANMAQLARLAIRHNIIEP